MRCLQCGKAIPLFKRLSGSSEFCSDAHRKEYQQEYSQLALGRLMQSHSGESQASPVQAPPLAVATAPAVNEKPAVANVPAVAKPRPAATQSAPAANGIPKSPPPPTIPVKKAVPLPGVSQPAVAKSAESQPAIAKAAAIQKPAPAILQFSLAAAPEFEHAFASLAPDRPRHQSGNLLSELPQGRAIEWESGVEIANSISRPPERKLDLREVPRSTPRVALDLRIVPPECLETEGRPLPIPIVLADPAEAFLWIGAQRDFTGELALLRDFANDQFSKADFECPVLAEGPKASAVAEAPNFEVLEIETLPLALSSVPAAVGEPLSAEPQAAVVETEPPPVDASPALTAVAELLPEQSQPAFVETELPAVEMPDPTFLVPALQLTPLPVACPGSVPMKAKPLPVFGPASVGAGIIQVPQPNGLPLRPVMVLVAATRAAEVKTGVKPRKGDGLSLRSVLSIEPEVSAVPNFGLPEPAPQVPAGLMASRMRQILAALTGAAVLGAGVFFFVGKQSNAGLKSATTALAGDASSGQWVANFAPDAKRQRRVSVLRSSMNLSAYRLDFESSIHIKALGWVYRAHDSKNFYVNKIEFQKPGQNPVYALVHYAVINGVEQARVETPLHVSVPMGGNYKIRFEAVGNRFTTWVQGQRVEQWTDSRLPSGGAGLYGEDAEQSILHGDFKVTPLSN